MSNKKTTNAKNQKVDDIAITPPPEIPVECQHATEVIAMPEGSSHKFKKVCTKCNRFLGWHSNIPKAESITGRKAIIGIISPYATNWEKNFFRSMLKIDKLSDKQLVTWKKIIDEYTLVGILKKSDYEELDLVI